MYGLVDDQYKVIRDPEAMTNPLDLAIATVFRSFPISDEGKFFGLVKGPQGIETPARSATVRGRLYREGSGVKQLTGRGTLRAKDIVDRALDTHKIARYRAFPRLKNPEVNDIAKDVYNEFTEQILFPFLAGREYTNVPNTPQGGRQQKLMFLEMLDLTKTKVHDEVIQRVGQKLQLYENSYPDDTKEIEKLQGQLEFMYKVKWKGLNYLQRKGAEAEFTKKPKNWEDWRNLYMIGSKVKAQR